MSRSPSALFGSIAVFAIAAALSTVADARPLHPVRHPHAAVHSARPLTVPGRSFLDPGNVVPVGSLSNYVNENTIYVQTPDQNFARSKFGNEALPNIFSNPGRQEPLFEFSTGGGNF